jgi:cytohesin
MRTPIHRAVGKGHNNVVSLLIEKGADLNAVDGGGLTPLHWAALFGLVQTGRLLVEGGAPVDAQTKSGETPLHLSAEKGKVQFVQFLLEAKADVNIKDKSAQGGATPYDVAKRAGQKEVMALLKPDEKPCACVIL